MKSAVERIKNPSVARRVQFITSEGICPGSGDGQGGIHGEFAVSPYLPLNSHWVAGPGVTVVEEPIFMEPALFIWVAGVKMRLCDADVAVAVGIKGRRVIT